MKKIICGMFVILGIANCEYGNAVGSSARVRMFMYLESEPQRAPVAAAAVAPRLQQVTPGGLVAANALYNYNNGNSIIICQTDVDQNSVNNGMAQVDVVHATNARPAYITIMGQPTDAGFQAVCDSLMNFPNPNCVKIRFYNARISNAFKAEIVLHSDRIRSLNFSNCNVNNADMANFRANGINDVSYE